MAIADKYKATKPKTEFYSDFATNLTPHPDTKELVRTTNENSIKRSIRNLILTDEYERPFQPEIKSNVKKTLFEVVSPQSSEGLRSAITEVVENHEPRAKLIDVEVLGNPDNHTYSVNISFYTINNPAPTTLSITLFRVR